jgi:leader peptidase (prepilin peptidase)/N-methyltransferase
MDAPLIAPSWLWPVLAAPFVGSFLGVLVARLPSGQPVVLGRSRCPRCGAALGVPDLLPLLSYAALRGRCRHCQQQIGIFHPAVELAALAIALCAAWADPDAARLWIDCGLGWTLLALGWIDQVSLLLPDMLTLPLILAGLVVTWLERPAAVPDHALAAALGYLSFQALALGYRHLRGQDGLGGGDAKLIAAAGAWCGLSDLPPIIFSSAVLGLIIALAGAVRQRRLDVRLQIPFGPCIAAAFWLAWLLPALPARMTAVLAG